MYHEDIPKIESWNNVVYFFLIKDLDKSIHN